MSKIGSEKMKAAIHEMLTTNHKERKFKETIDLQIGLKDYDINKDKRFSGVVKLPYVVRPRLKICVIADAVHSEQCKKNNIDFITTDSLSKKIDPDDKKGKQLKKWCRHYKILFVSESIVSQLPKLGGKFFAKWGKFPFVIKGNEQVAEFKHTVLSVCTYSDIRLSSFFVRGPVVIHPERIASLTSAASLSVISGGEK